VGELIAVVPHPERIDPDALRESLAQSGYRVGDVSVVLREALSDQEKTNNG